MKKIAKKGLLGKIKPYTFTLFAKNMEKKLLDCLERNEKMGVVNHRDGINGDYDDFDDVVANEFYLNRSEITSSL